MVVCVECQRCVVFVVRWLWASVAMSLFGEAGSPANAWIDDFSELEGARAVCERVSGFATYLA